MSAGTFLTRCMSVGKLGGGAIWVISLRASLAHLELRQKRMSFSKNSRMLFWCTIYQRAALSEQKMQMRLRSAGGINFGSKNSFLPSNLKTEAFLLPCFASAADAVLCRLKSTTFPMSSSFFPGYAISSRSALSGQSFRNFFTPHHRMPRGASPRDECEKSRRAIHPNAAGVSLWHGVYFSPGIFSISFS